MTAPDPQLELDAAPTPAAAHLVDVLARSANLGLPLRSTGYATEVLDAYDVSRLPEPQAILPPADRLAVASEVYLLIESVFEPWIEASTSAERIADLNTVSVERAVAEIVRRAEVRWLTPGQSIDFHAVLEPAGLWPAYGAIVAGGTWAAFFAAQRPLGNRAFGEPARPGRLDRDGVQWWACDPYPCWFRWPDGGELVEARIDIAWADEPKPFKREPCGRSCRLNSWSNYCHCQGWCF